MAPPSQLPHVGLVGVWPPPWGGISVHIKRLHDRLRGRGYPVSVFDNAGGDRPLPTDIDIRALTPDRRLSARVTEAALAAGVDLLNLHVFGAEWKMLLPFSMVQEATGIPLVVTMHSMRVPASALPRLERQLFSVAARRIDRFFCAGEHVRTSLLEIGVAPERVQTIVPFLQPSADELDDGQLPAEVEAFLRSVTRRYLETATPREAERHLKLLRRTEGRVPHALLLEILTDQAFGTLIRSH